MQAVNSEEGGRHRKWAEYIAPLLHASCGDDVLREVPDADAKTAPKTDAVLHGGEGGIRTRG